MRRFGRNDLCPCGSGKKYKGCCLGRANDVAAVQPLEAHELHQLDDRLCQAISAFAGDWFEDWDPFMDYPGDVDHPACIQLVRPWAIYHYDDDDGRTTAQVYVAESGAPLTPNERAWLAAQDGAWLSCWEAVEVDPGRGLRVRDLITGEERFVHERSGSEAIAPFDVLLARVVDYSGVSVICGTHPQPLQPRDAAAVVDAVRLCAKRAKLRLDADLLRDPNFVAVLIESWDLAVATCAQRRPKLQNTDGDEFVMVEDRYDFAQDRLQELVARLSSMDRTTRDDDDGGDVIRIAFLRDGNAIHQSWDNTIIGKGSLSNDALVIETNSVRRADALRQRIDAACEGLVVHRERTQQSSDDLWKLAREGLPRPERERTAEELALVRQVKDEHYRAWLDNPLPALGGKTPRQAARTMRGRRELEMMMKELVNREARLPAEERFDVRFLRQELRLDRKAAAASSAS